MPQKVELFLYGLYKKYLKLVGRCCRRVHMLKLPNEFRWNLVLGDLHSPRYEVPTAVAIKIVYFFCDMKPYNVVDLADVSKEPAASIVGVASTVKIVRRILFCSYRPNKHLLYVKLNEILPVFSKGH
jgi:hypothetical protein